MTLFGVLPGASARRPLAAWETIGRRWQTYEAPPIEVDARGQLRLEVIAPSSYAAAPERLWVDDAELVETIPPAIVSLATGEGFKDDPSLARTSDGEVYAAWLSFRNGADSVQIARLAPDGEPWKPVARWQVEGGPGSRVLSPRLAAAGEGALLVYAAEIRGDWQTCAVPITAAGPGARFVFGDAGADVDPAATWHGGRAWLAWEASRQGRRRIYVARLENGRAGPVECLSSPDFNACDPAIAATAAGEITVAWHDFRNGQVDIYARTWSPTHGAWSPERRWTASPSIDRHPVLAPRGDDMWLLYETAQVREYHVGATVDRTLRLVRVGPAGLEAPLAGDGPLAAGSEGAAAAWDDAGRLWVAWLAPNEVGKALGWNVCLAVFDGEAWSELGVVNPRKGMDRRPGLAVSGGAALVLH